jgi:hypothetical protein
VLYKYLNPNTVAIVTSSINEEKKTMLKLYLIDTIVGSILYKTAIPGANDPHLSETPKLYLQFVENWIVFGYYNHGPSYVEEIDFSFIDEELQPEKVNSRGSKLRKPSVDIPSAPFIKSWELLVLEMFENEKPDVRDESLEFSSYTAKKPYVIQQSYLIPNEIQGMGVTSTKSGITAREVLCMIHFYLLSVALENNRIYGVSKWLLDPRRPIGSPSASDKEEGLIPYKANIDYNPKEVPSYGQDVMGIHTILSAPTALESTSIVFAFGHDMFLTKRAPSKEFDVLSESFGYQTLLLTILVLFVGIQVTKRMVRIIQC